VVNNYIVVKEATKKGYAEAFVGDGLYLNRPHQKRGVVQKESIPTLKTSKNDIGVCVANDEYISIRKLTPREAWRLMGWDDKDIDLVLGKVSDTALYKCAGNSIVISVLEAIFKSLFADEKIKNDSLIQTVLYRDNNLETKGNVI
jgi:DNA (cytosine-5)-methyltransferase 1